MLFLYPALLVNNLAVSLLASFGLNRGLLSALVELWIPFTHMWVFLLEPWILSALFYLLWRSTSVLSSHCSSMPWYLWTLCCLTIRNSTTNPKHMGLRHSSRRISKPDRHWTQKRENSNPDVLLVSLWSHWGKTPKRLLDPDSVAQSWCSEIYPLTLHWKGESRNEEGFVYKLA